MRNFMGKERHKAIPAVYLIVLKEGKALLSLRQNTGYCDGMYGLISGHVEKDESIVNAMIREAKEESGISIEKSNLEFATVMYRKTDDWRVDFFFHLINFNGKFKNLEPQKCAGLNFFDLKDLPENIIPHVKEALENFISKTSFSEHGFLN
jgi:8-oxo-dGTP diphosphatase